MASHPTREGLDLLDGSWYADNPHEIWSWMRREAPVYYDEHSDVWGIARYDDVLAIERNPGTFSSSQGPRPHVPPFPMMIAMDNPEHHRRRGLVSRGFTPRRIAQYEDIITRTCTKILDDVCEKGSCDFVWDVAAPLPLLLIADMLGFDPALHDDLLEWSDDLVRATNGNMTDEVATKGANAMMAFRECQMAVIADRRENPRDDLISTLCQATIDGEQLDDESILNETLLILIGGDETTRHVITDGTLALINHPDQAELLVQDENFAVGIEELLRWVSPVKNMARTVTHDVEVGDQLLHEGDHLILYYPSANRDETVFDHADRFDVRRDPNPHLAFGFGPHFCLGASLARLELKVMFREVLRRLPDLRLADGAVLPYRHSNFITGPEAMPVEFTPTARTT